MSLLGGLILGLVIGIVVVPIFFIFLAIIKRTRDRRRIKKMIRQNKFLVPIDTRDYDSVVWKDLINADKNGEYLKSMNKSIFDKPFDEEFMKGCNEYISKAKEAGLTNEQITLNMKKNNYPENLIQNLLK